MAGPLQAMRRASGSKAPDNRAVQAATQTNREKGLWNFLTWSFFIAQVLVAEKFLGAPAHAAEAQEHSSPQAAPAPNELAGKPLVAPENPAHANAEGALAGPQDEASLDAAARSLISEIKPATTSDDPAATGSSAEVAVAASGGGGDAELPAINETDTAPPAFEPVFAVESPLALADPDLIPTGPSQGGDVPVGNVVEGAETLLDEVVETVTGSVDEVVELLNATVSQALGLLTEIGLPIPPALEATVSAATSVVGSVATVAEETVGNTLEVAEEVVSSAGRLVFSTVENLLPNELFANNVYTTLGLTVATEPVGTATTAVANTTGTVLGLLEHVLGGDPGQAETEEHEPHSSHVALPANPETGLLHGLGLGLG